MKRPLVLLALLVAGCSTKQESSAVVPQTLDKTANTEAVATAMASSASRGGEKDSDRAHAATPAPTTTTALAGGMIGGQGFASPIRAGEWDDNANYREFQRYIGATGEPIHSADVRARRFLVVRDVAGKAVSRCPVT